MIAVCLYIAILLVAASVLVNRMGERRMKAAQTALVERDRDLQALDQQIQDGEKALGLSRNRLSELDGRVEEEKARVQALGQQFETVQKAAPERFHVFDRLEPRPGVIWEVPVRRSPDVVTFSAGLARAWREGRTDLIVATTQREALERPTQEAGRRSRHHADGGHCSRRGERAERGESESACAQPGYRDGDDLRSSRGLVIAEPRRRRVVGLGRSAAIRRRHRQILYWMFAAA